MNSEPTNDSPDLMRRTDAHASFLSSMPEQSAQAHATNGRTDELTQKNSPQVDISPNASRAGGHTEFAIEWAWKDGRTFIGQPVARSVAERFVAAPASKDVDPRASRVVQRECTEWAEVTE